MSSTDLVVAICVAVAVAILVAAICWALMDVRRDGAQGDERPSPQRRNSRSLKGKGS